MKIEVSDCTLVDELAHTLRGYDYRVIRSGANELRVGLGPDHWGALRVLGTAELELDMYLTAWQAVHPGIRAHRTG